jgi:hypothetical protein
MNSRSIAFAFLVLVVVEPPVWQAMEAATPSRLHILDDNILMKRFKDLKHGRMNLPQTSCHT